jgi:CheY-like chemotaxis protein
MNILLLEDDEDKSRQVRDFLKLLIPSAHITESRSLRSGLEAIKSASYDLVILDMSVPSFDIDEREDGGRPQAYGGRDLLQHMKRRKVLSPVVVLTQFDRFADAGNTSTLEELDISLRAAHSDQYLGAIYYDVSAPIWKAKLEAIVTQIQTSPQDDART